MSNFYNDGGYSWGSHVLPISGSASLLGNYVAENITVTFPSDIIEIRNQLNGPAGAIGISGFVNGSTTLQIGSGQAFPHNGATFGLNGRVFWFNEIGDTRAQGEIYKANCNFRMRQN